MKPSFKSKSFEFLKHNGPIPFAHRGGTTEYPENTLPAFENAVSLGYTYLETDVHATIDGEVIAFHDDSLDRLTNNDEKISQLTSREVSEVKIQEKFSIPKFIELLETFPKAKINIDPKTDSVVEPLIKILSATNSVERVCIGSFSDKRIQRIRQALGPRLCTSAGPSSVAKFLADRWGLFTKRPRYQCLQVPEHSGPVKIINKNFINRAHKGDLQVHVWTIDDSSKMHELLDLGVDGIMTDQPLILKNVLIERGLWNN
mgnify:CR=1 FL=1